MFMKQNEQGRKICVLPSVTNLVDLFLGSTSFVELIVINSNTYIHKCKLVTTDDVVAVVAVVAVVVMVVVLVVGFALVVAVVSVVVSRIAVCRIRTIVQKKQSYLNVSLLRFLNQCAGGCSEMCLSSYIGVSMDMYGL